LRGIIVHFDRTNKFGFIKGTNGKVYHFDNPSFPIELQPRGVSRQRVTFDPVPAPGFKHDSAENIKILT
jgi:hypothetical protein